MERQLTSYLWDEDFDDDASVASADFDDDPEENCTEEDRTEDMGDMQVRLTSSPNSTDSEVL